MGYFRPWFRLFKFKNWTSAIFLALFCKGRRTLYVEMAKRAARPGTALHGQTRHD
jgi:hypothetical protein